jgi:pimeloyl-ACP methyl ester carboxylesterase
VIRTKASLIKRGVMYAATLPLVALTLGFTSSQSAPAANAAAVASNPVPQSGSDVSIWNGATDKSGSGATCGDYMFQVSLSAGQPKSYHLFGRLCHQGAVEGKTLQVLVNGGTYDHTYWDFPYAPGKYSYVKWASDAGYVTLNLDRLGYGYSSHADPLGSNFAMQGWAVHQVIQEIRAGQLGANFYRIVLAGHSMGSFTAWDEAGTYHDVDGVIITGAEHTANPVKLSQVIAAILEPAQLDARFASLPLGYFTTFPGMRCQTLFYLPNTDPNVCAEDEATKSTVSTAEIADIAPAVLNTTLSDSINVPVLMVDGQYDTFYCLGSCTDEYAKAQGADYASAPCYDSFILPNSGHDVNLELNSTEWFMRANSWVQDRIGVSSTQPAASACN